VRVAAIALAAMAVLAALPVVAQTSYTCERVVYEVFVDGSVFVNYTINVEEAPATIVLEPEAPPVLAWAVDEAGNVIPVDFNDTSIAFTVYEPATVNVTYYTLSLTSKNGPYWTLNVAPPCTAYIVLPDEAVPIEVNPANPEVALVNGRLALVFQPGNVSITYMLVPPPPPPPGEAETTTTSTAGAAAPTGTAATTTTTAAAGGTGETPAATTTGTAGGEAPLAADGGSATLAAALVAVAAAGLFLAFRLRNRGGGGQAPTVSTRAALDERDQLIVEALRSGPKTASELMQETGIPKTPLYRRLKRLVEEGIVEAFDEGGVRKYRLRG